MRRTRGGQLVGAPLPVRTSRRLCARTCCPATDAAVGGRFLRVLAPASLPALCCRRLGGGSRACVISAAAGFCALGVLWPLRAFVRWVLWLLGALTCFRVLG